MGNALERYDFIASRMDVDKLNPPWLAVTLKNVQGKELRRAYYPPFVPCRQQRHGSEKGIARSHLASMRR